MSTSSPSSATAYEACLSEALRQCPLLIQRWSSKLVDALYERAVGTLSPPEKRQLQDAVTALKTSRQVIEEAFAGEVARAMGDDIRPAEARSAGNSARSFSSLSFDELELMGDSQVQETVETARLQQIVVAACESGLAGFSARLSTAQGFKGVKADKNPLRPEVMAQVLFRMLQEVKVDSVLRNLWLLHGALPFGQELQALYLLLNDQLAALGIAPAAYSVIASPVPKSRTVRLPDTVDAGPEAAVASPAAPVLTLDHLHRLLVGDFDESFKNGTLPSGFNPASQQGFSHTVPAAMEVLAELQEKGIAATRAQKTRITPPLPLAQMRAQLKTEAKSLGQSLAIEVVGLMMEQMANDARLLAPVREVIANAEPAFLRLGVTDPRFFSDKDHPARKLLETITAKSLAYASEDAPGFLGFMDNLRQTAAYLTEEDAGDVGHFDTLLRDFESRLAENSAGNSASRGRAVQALLQAEQRNLLAEKIAAEIRARPDFVAGNRIIAGFITGPWAQVMAKERLLGEHGSQSSQKAVYSLTLGEMLWSLDVAQASRHRKRLLKMIPEMLQSLREGLLSIDYALEKSKPFFDELMSIHQAALHTEPVPLDARARDRRDLEKAFGAGDEASSKKTWLAPTEAQNSGFMEDWGPDTKPGFESTRPQLKDDARPSAASVGGNAGAPDSVKLRLGAWVELFQDDKWLRAQLTWISPYNTLFLFTSEGGRTHSMTGPLLQYLLLQDLVKVINQQGVLEGALDNVARKAMRNSVDGAS